ncbi:MAG: DUF1684 domain-containing protein [Planctomycetaceae bacterium]
MSLSPFIATVVWFPILLSMIPLCAVFQDPVDDWIAETERWRELRERQLRSADGWLAVTGLHWLEQDEVRFGSAPDCEIRLAAESSPAEGGRFTVTGGVVLFTAADGASLRFNGKPAKNGILTLTGTGPEADSADRLSIGSSTLQLLRRTGKLAIRIRDSNSGLIRDFPGERWFPPNQAYRIPARFVAAAPGSSIEFQNVRGATLSQELAGTVEFEFEGRLWRLQATQDEPGKLFVAFRDQTSGQQTWPGGRFLSVDLPKDDTSVVLDFNRAYNPPCAYNPYTLCPLPPSQNHLSISISAGALRPHVSPAGSK